MHCLQKELDTFPTTYAKDFVWHRTAPKFYSPPQFDAYALTEDEKKAFINIHATKELPWETQLAIIKNLYAQRMKTVYHVSYCESDKKEKDKESNENNEQDQDTLFAVADKLYTKKSQKVLQPIPTSRRVLGYCRPTLYYTGLSEYQDEYGRLGYQALLPTRHTRLDQRLPFCDQFKKKH